MARGYRLRRARLADVPRLAALETQFPTDRLSHANLHHLLTRARADVLVIDAVGLPVADAVVLYRKNSSAARLYSLVVDPRHRGRGLGKRLLDAAEAAARRRGRRTMSLEVRPRNRDAHKLYQRCGYARSVTIEDFYEDGTP